MKDGITLDGVLLVVQGEGDLGDTLKLLDQASGGRRMLPTKNTNFRSGRNWTVLRWLVHLLSGAIAGIKAGLESQDDQVGNVSGLLVGGWAVADKMA